MSLAGYLSGLGGLIGHPKFTYDAYKFNGDTVLLTYSKCRCNNIPVRIEKPFKHTRTSNLLTGRRLMGYPHG